MAPSADTTMPATRRARKSVGSHMDFHKSLEKENATTDLSTSLAASRKKSRSKSIGPGGLDALKQGSGNRRASLAVPAKAPRSILKSTIAPLAEIPPLKTHTEPDLIDLGEPTRSSAIQSQPGSAENSGSKIALRTEEEQHAAARQREERERRDARRKSLANRRVSFAAEATLHTFHEVEYMQDATGSTDSTRRNSAHQGAPGTASDKQDKQRRSSGLPAPNFNNRDDDTATSTMYSSDSEPADAIEEVAEVEDENSSNESDDGTMMSMETEEVTGASMMSDRTVESADESSTLDEALRLAARTAGAQQLNDEAEDDLDDDEEFIPAFGWGKDTNKKTPVAQDQENRPPERSFHYQPPDADADADADTGMETDMDMDMDMDMTRPMGGIVRPSHDPTTEVDGELSMDVTGAIGGILSQNGAHQNDPQAIEDDESDAPMEEATMEFTRAIGGIHRSAPPGDEESDGNEDMSMELTTVMGGVLSQQKRKSVGPARRRTINQTRNLDEDETAAMDMTVPVGRILPGSANNDLDDDEDEDGDATMGMEMTTAIGGILGNATDKSRSLGKRIMEEEADTPGSPRQAVLAAVNKNTPQKQQTAGEIAPTEPELISPGLSAFQGKGLRRSNVGLPATTPPSGAKAKKTPLATNSASRVARTAPTTKTPTHVKSATPKTSSSTTRTSLRNSTHQGRSASPKRISPGKGTTATPSPAKSPRKNGLFQNDQGTGGRTPTVVLTPKSRRVSGVGADRVGLGSPQVAAKFDRRESIGNSATEFVPGKRAVAFQDPREIQEEIDNDRQEEFEKESGRRILEREADGSPSDREATLNLREMIDSLSPKRNHLKGRKSLHVGSAKGVLGKRPSELDDEEEEEENDGVKRLKGHQGSPVKNVKLQQPGSMAESTGRLARSLRAEVQQNSNRSTPPSSSPMRLSPATTPRHQGHFKDVQYGHTTPTVDFAVSPVKDAAQLEREADEGRIHLQDFLNMTSIRFMELTTTKRRHTAAPASFRDGATLDGTEDLSLERCVVVGACTVPMLELYQHSCRELKKYISEGRRMVKEIETDTFEDNPPLFKEYMAATPDVKALMDNQFKNVKTHARLLSKAMWYEWRMMLQDGLKEGLLSIDEGMKTDEKTLERQRKLLDSVMSDAMARYEALAEESTNLEEVAKDLAECDPSELEAARDELASLDDDVRTKKKLIAELREQLQNSEAETEELSAQKQQCLADIKESERIREECRGWTSTEVNALKERVDTMEKEHGWAVTGTSGSTLSMTYKREIELVFDAAAFQTHKPNARIDLWYIADTRERDPLPRTTEKEFYVQALRDQARAIPQNRTKAADLLAMIGRAWDNANMVSSQISHLDVSFPTNVNKTSDSSVALTSSLLLVPLETRVEITFNFHARSDPEGLDISILPEASVIYGEHFNVAKIGEFLATRVGKHVGASEETWSDILVELHDRLIARGRK